MIGNIARQRALTPASPQMPPGGGTLLLNALSDPRYPDSAAWVVGSTLLPADFYRRASDRELLRQVAGATLTWMPNARFRSWLRVAGVWDRQMQRQAVPDSMPLGGQPVVMVDSLAYRDEQVQVELGLSRRIDIGALRLTMTPTYQLRDRQPSRYLAQGVGEFVSWQRFEDAYRIAGGALRTEVTTSDGRVGLGGVVRRDEARRFDRWEQPTWGYGLRAWWTGVISGHAAYSVAERRPDPDGVLVLSVVPVGTDVVPIGDVAPERLREFELGLRARDRSGRWEAGATGFSQRTTDGWGTRMASPGGGFVPFMDNVGAEITNTGVEIDANAWLVRGSTWQARTGVVGSWLSSKLTSNGAGIPATLLPGFCSFEQHEPFARCGRAMPNVVDLNGDGLLSSAEYPEVGTTPYEARGSSMPTRTVGVWLDVTRAFRSGSISALGHFDYLGGQWSEGVIAAAQCFYGVCRNGNDPSASLEEQAAMFADFGMYFLRDASFGRMRELTVSWQTSGGVARWLGSDRVSLGVTMRNLFTVSGFRYWDPEVRQRANEHAPYDQEGVPLPRTLTIKLAVDW